MFHTLDYFVWGALGGIPLGLFLKWLLDKLIARSQKHKFSTKFDNHDIPFISCDKCLSDNPDTKCKGDKNV